MNTISNQDSVIDSRDVIARIEELESALQAQYEEENPDGEDFDGWLEETKDADEQHELLALRALAEEGAESPDWSYGESLINEDYFTQYIEELIDDCYEMPKEISSGEWPWRHVTIDYAAAADEVKDDYMEVDFDGATYLIRA